MSLFKFSSLPLEIGEMVATRVVKQYTGEMEESNKDRKVREQILKELSTMTKSFAKPAQKALFSKIFMDKKSGIQGLLDVLQSNESLGLMIQEMTLKFGGKPTLAKKSEDSLVLLLDQCNALTRLHVTGIPIRMEFLARAKAVKRLSLDSVIVQKSKSLPTFNHLNSIFLSNISKLEELVNVTPVQVPSLVTLSVRFVENWSQLAQLFDQIINLSVNGTAKLSDRNNTRVFDKFTNLKFIDFFGVPEVGFIERVLRQIPSHITAIRMDTGRDDRIFDEADFASFGSSELPFEWDEFSQIFTEGQVQSVLHLKAVYATYFDLGEENEGVRVGDLYDAQDCCIAGLEEREIDVNFSYGPSFEVWIRRMKAYRF